MKDTETAVGSAPETPTWPHPLGSSPRSHGGPATFSPPAKNRSDYETKGTEGTKERAGARTRQDKGPKETTPKEPLPPQTVLPSPPPLMPDGLQFSWGVSSVLGPDFPKGTKSQPVPEGVCRYFPESRAHFHRRNIYAGAKQGDQARLRANGHSLAKNALERQNGGSTGRIKGVQNFFTKTVRENLVANCPDGKLPFDLVLEELETGLQLLSEELCRIAQSNLENSAQAIQLPSQLYRVEMCRDYWPVTKTASEALKEAFLRAAVHQSDNLYLEREWPNGGCPRFRVQARLVKREFGPKEKTFIKGYPKPDLFRLEVTYEYPRTQQPVRTPKELCAELREIAKDAAIRLDQIHPALVGAVKATHATESALVAALTAYGIRDVGNNKRWLELCRQIAERGVYDPATISATLRVSRETLRERVAHPTWGILKKVPRGAGTGAGGIPFYLLRPDWEIAFHSYPPLCAQLLGDDDLITSIRYFQSEDKRGKEWHAILWAMESEMKKRLMSGDMDPTYDLALDHHPSAFRK